MEEMGKEKRSREEKRHLVSKFNLAKREDILFCKRKRQKERQREKETKRKRER